MTSILTRRNILKLLASLVGSKVVGKVDIAHGVAGPMDKPAEDIKRRRREAANRRRRIIFNNDGNDVFPPYSDDPQLTHAATGKTGNTPATQPAPFVKPVTAEEVLRHRSLPVLDTEVDSIFYCTLSSGFGMFTHNTKVGEVFGKKAGILPYNITQDLIDKGTDPLRITVDFCRQHGLEIFWSMRMNDTHDASYAANEPAPLLFPKLKAEHPEYLFGTRDRPPKYGSWSAVDYGRPEIRELAFRYIEEVCQNYDVDGVELDFTRHPQLFKGVSERGFATQEELDTMTAFMRRVRQMTDATGAQRKKPLLIALKVPDSVGFCRAIGIDLEQWLATDMVDIFAPGGYFQLNPYAYSVDLGHKYGLKVYPEFEESRVPVEATAVYRDIFDWYDTILDHRRRSDEAYYGRAMDSLSSGADGIYLFDFCWEYEGYHMSLSNFASHRTVLQRLGDPQALEKLDKLYFASVLGAGAPHGVNDPGRYVANPEQYFHKSVLTVWQPLTIENGAPHSIPVSVGDDLRFDAKEGMHPRVNCRLRIDQPNVAGQLSVKLNDVVLKDGTQTENWLNYVVDPSVVKKGINQVDIALKSGGNKLILSDLVLNIQLVS